MRDTKRKLELFSFYDHSGIQQHLEQMAEKGWMLEQPGTYLWRYRRIAPQKLHFAVTYFPNASEFDPGPTEGQQILQDYCEAAGWQYVTRWAQMQIFCTADEDPVPLETDALTQVDTIHAAMKRASLPGLVIMVLLALFQLGFQCWQFLEDTIDFLATPSYLYMVPAWLLILLVNVYELVFYFRWHKKAKTAAETTGEFIPIRTRHGFSMAVLTLALAFVALALLLQADRGMMFFMAVWFIGMALIFLWVNSIKKTLQKMNASRGVNRTVTLVVCVALTMALMADLTAATLRGLRSGWLEDDPSVETYTYKGWEWDVYHDEIPLRVEDLIDTDYDQWSTEETVNSSILLAFREYSQRPRMDALDQPDLEYDIVEIKLSALYELCKKSMLERYWYNDPEEFRSVYLPEDGFPGAADEVYRYYSRYYDEYTPYDRYLLCWEGRIAEIRFDGEPTPEQLYTAAEILKTA
ncbi:MAG: DUF2812 domain-containing protein [Oscillibacter sp.]|nr:DUF2812 domain-containing protein [Oscillibacter sp.]